jgi:hypothetical protein
MCQPVKTLARSATDPVQLPALRIPRGIVSNIVSPPVPSNRGDRDIRMQAGARWDKDRDDLGVWFRLRFSIFDFECHPVLFEDLLRARDQTQASRDVTTISKLTEGCWQKSMAFKWEDTKVSVASAQIRHQSAVPKIATQSIFGSSGSLTVGVPINRNASDSAA